MLNEKGQRELAYVVKVDDILPIEGKDRVECAVVGGWTCMVPKGQFKKGDLGVYFEIDSKCPAKEPFLFLEKRNYKVKTQRFKAGEGHFYSQGLLMSFSDFRWEADKYEVGTFLTQELGVTYADAADNKRKANSTTDKNKKYQRMMNRHPKLARSKFGRWCMKHDFAKRLLFLLLGRKNDFPKDFPYWVVKTDEERIQNLVSRIPEFRSEEWIVTEKRDGTSTTITLKGKGRNQEYAVCSRNVRMENRKDGSWYKKNVYAEMADKYKIKDVLSDLLAKNDCEFVTIQGETFGATVQKRDYGLAGRKFEAFNVIFGYKDGTTKRLNPVEMKNLLDKYDVPTVPIVAEHVMLPETCEEILAMAKGEAAIYGGMREGLVFRTYDGVKSFKAVDNDFLVKYHG